MSHMPRAFKPAVRPGDCWDWITPEEVCRHALASFYRACEAMKQPQPDQFIDSDGGPWSDRRGFADTLTALFDMRIKTDAYHLGLSPDWSNEARMLQCWSVPAAAPGYGAAPHVSAATLTPNQHGQHGKADPAGSAPDAVHLAQTSPDALARPEKPLRSV